MMIGRISNNQSWRATNILNGSDIKNLMSSMSALEVSGVVEVSEPKELDLGEARVLYEGVARASSGKAAGLACQALSAFLYKHSARTVFSAPMVRHFLMASLHGGPQADPSVISLSLEQLSRLLPSSSSSSSSSPPPLFELSRNVFASPDLGAILLLLALLSSPSSRVALSASSLLLSALSAHRLHLAFLRNPSVAHHFSTALGPIPIPSSTPVSSSPLVKDERFFRHLSLLLSIAAVSQELSEAAASLASPLDRLLLLLADPDDVLARMAALELLLVAAGSPWLSGCLQAKGAFQAVEAMLEEPLLAPQALTAATQLLQQPHHELTVSRRLTDALHSALSPGSQTLGVGLMCAAVMSASPQRAAVLQNEGLMERLRFWCSSARERSHQELLLDALAVHFASDGASRELLEGLGELLLVVMAAAGLRGSDELRMTALRALLAICSHGWGAEAVVEFPGFLELVRDRGAETLPEGHHLRYKIVARLLRDHQEVCEGFWEADEMADLRTYLAEGPVFVARTPATFKVADDTQ